MSKFQLNRRASEDQAVIDADRPSFALVRAHESPRSQAQPNDVVDDEFRSGIRALHGQLWCRESATQGPLRSVGVTSCYGGEGKSTVAAQLAAVAAESKRVLLIDASASRPLVHRAMQDVAGPSAASRSEALLTSEARNHPPICPTAVLPPLLTNGQPTIDETRNLLDTLADEFDLLIVDLASLETATALEWAPLLDGIVLVIEAERVRWQVAARGVALLEQTGSNVLGTVINKRRNYIPSWLYRRL